ncbi:MAG TPA: hypothetical protein VFN68_14225 [Acidimicrobiales bacterium]|nr:hypothetical protein [Acidimicrobiales bacterium]
MNAGADPPIRWVSGRSLMLHAALAVALPMCAVAAWWQVDRALAGNTLSWLYVFEWPAFAALSIWLWWVLVTSAGRSAGDGWPAGGVAPVTSGTGRQADGRELMARRSVPPRWETASESASLRAYNDYLRQLADRPSGAPLPRRPRARSR